MQLRLIFGTKNRGNLAWVKSFFVVLMRVFSLSGEILKMYRVVHESDRWAVVRRFPYVVFSEHSDNTVIVYSVFHCSQDPKKWRSRLP